VRKKKGLFGAKKPQPVAAVKLSDDDMNKSLDDLIQKKKKGSNKKWKGKDKSQKYPDLDAEEMNMSLDQVVNKYTKGNNGNKRGWKNNRKGGWTKQQRKDWNNRGRGRGRGRGRKNWNQGNSGWSNNNWQWWSKESRENWNKSKQSQKSWNNNRGKKMYSKAWKGNKNLQSEQTVVNQNISELEDSPVELLQKLVLTYSLKPTIAVTSEKALADNSTALQIQIDMDCSLIEDKTPGSFVLRQLAWGRTKDEAKRRAIQELLKHETLVRLKKRLVEKEKPKSEPLFPGLNKT